MTYIPKILAQMIDVFKPQQKAVLALLYRGSRLSAHPTSSPRLAYVDFNGIALLEILSPATLPSMTSRAELYHLRVGIKALVDWLSAL